MFWLFCFPVEWNLGKALFKIGFFINSNLDIHLIYQKFVTDTNNFGNFKLASGVKEIHIFYFKCQIIIYHSVNFLYKDLKNINKERGPG